MGKSAITVCFNGADGEHGSYYYQRIRTPIQLTQANDNAPWVEEGNTVSGPCKNLRAITFWCLSKTDRGTPLPLALRRIGTDGCGSDAYNAPMEAAPLPIKTEKKTFHNHTYQLKTQGPRVTLKLEGDGPAVQKINQQLAALAVNDEDLTDYFMNGVNTWVETARSIPVRSRLSPPIGHRNFSPCGSTAGPQAKAPWASVGACTPGTCKPVTVWTHGPGSAAISNGMTPIPAI